VAGVERTNVDGSLLDEAFNHYRSSGIAGTECKAFLDQELPEWLDIIHPTIGQRLEAASSLSDPDYAFAVEEHYRFMSLANRLFVEGALLALPTTIITPPPVAELDDMSVYLKANMTALRPTCCVNMLGLCALTIPVGLDDEGMPVGLQLVGAAGADEVVLAAGLAIERALGTARDRLGTPVCA
jgi:aspartyl-tRNA(Asn)/glutamyl-tRNA(Gln) amidotransferase subunit A